VRVERFEELGHLPLELRLDFPFDACSGKKIKNKKVEKRRKKGGGVEERRGET